MWALPDINRLNKEAEENSKKKNTISLEGKACELCLNQAAIYVNYYDVFSDYPKGQLFFCDNENHNEHELEGFFYCDLCGRLHISNYTWEYYHTMGPDGYICLNCALDNYLAEKGNWIALQDVNKLDFERIRTAPHLIPVSGTYWKKKLNFVGNVEFDNMDGHCISGGGIEELKELCRTAIKKAKTKRCYIIMDAAYQFAISMGVYYKK